MESGMCEHLFIVAINSNPKLFIFVVILGPFDLMRLRAANGQNLRPGHPIKQSVNMAFALGLISGSALKRL